MPGLLPNVDPDGLLEFSVVYTDRSLNHMSEEFKRVMVDISSVLKDAYNASSAVIVPGSGTFGMEAVARQFANNQKCLVLFFFLPSNFLKFNFFVDFDIK